MELTNQKLIDEVISIVGPGEESRWGNEKGLTVSLTGNTVIIEHAQMYEFCEVNFELMEKLSKLFNSKKINVDTSDSYSGCETCDYGSRYYTKIYIDQADVSKWT